MNLLLSTEGVLTPSCSKTHITFQFYVPTSYDRLSIHFAYSPKTLDDLELSKQLIEEGLRKYVQPEHYDQYQKNWQTNLPLKNLITVSVDDPEGFRGSGHRHDQEQTLILSKDEVSPGLVRGPIGTGVWKVTLSAHCIVTDTCSYRLHVLGGAN